MGSKIVRDNVGAWARKHGVSGQWRPCPEPIPALRKKIGEEFGEYVESNNPAELYDLQDVLARLIQLSDPSGTYALAHLRKVSRLGMFEKLIEWTPVPAEHEDQVDVPAAPDHDWSMPHDVRVTSVTPDDPNGCPPNCPYRIWAAENEGNSDGN